MSETLRERVARKLSMDRDLHIGGPDATPFGKPNWEYRASDADAALSVIREHLQSDAAVERVMWAICPILRAADECDMPQIMHGPHPECRHCPPREARGGTAGCRIVADLVARAALTAALWG